MQRIAKILAALAFASGILGADMAWAHGPGGGWHGGWGGGWGWGGWGWGYPYGYWPYDYGYGYDYPYGYGYPPPQQPAISPYCATRARICTLSHAHAVGSPCSCRGAHGIISGGPPPQ